MTDRPIDRRKLSYEAFTECWYVPGETHIVDLIHPDDGLTLHYHEDALAVRDRYPAAERMSCDDAWKLIDAAALAQYRKDVSEVTEERFMDALNVLPPVGWTTHNGVESFRISERLWGNITDIYARLGDRYFVLSDDIRLSPAIVAERVTAYAATHHAANTADRDGIEARRPSDAQLAPGVPLAAPKPGSSS